jgi:hypothetical protein
MRISNTLLVVALLAVTSLVFPNEANASAETLVSIDPAIYEVPEPMIGELFQLNLTVVNVTSLWSWKARINWDPAILNFSSIQEGPFLSDVYSTLFLVSQNWTAINVGYLPEASCRLAASSGANGSGLLATLTFRAIASGVTSITLNETRLREPMGVADIPHAVSDGQVTVIPEFPDSAIAVVLMILTSPILLRRKRRWQINRP